MTHPPDAEPSVAHFTCPDCSAIYEAGEAHQCPPAANAHQIMVKHEIVDAQPDSPLSNLYSRLTAAQHEVGILLAAGRMWARGRPGAKPTSDKDREAYATSLMEEEIPGQILRNQRVADVLDRFEEKTRERCGPDPWKHRSLSMKCSSCMWYVQKTLARSDDPRLDVELGRCRRRAPTMNGYPAVFTTDWCGDHKLDETKL